VTKARESRRYIFRASDAEAAAIDSLAKMFPDSGGQPNYSQAIRFIIQFFVVQSNLQPEESKEVIATMYDRLLAGGHIKNGPPKDPSRH
jgi:hypothetical protein